MAAVLTLPRSWGRRKPPCGTPPNRSKVRSLGIVALYGMAEGGGVALRELTGRSLAASIVGSPAPVWTQGDRGAAVSHNGAAGWIDGGTPAAVTALNAMTVSAFVRPAATTRGDWVSMWGGTTGTDRKFDLLQGFSGSAFSFFCGNASTFASTPSVTAATVGRDVLVTGTYDGSTIAIYVNGVLEGTAALAGPLVTSGAISLQIGGSNAGAFASGLIYRALVAERPWTAAEVRADALDPWALWAPPAPRMSLVPPAAGPATPHYLALTGCGS
jgi:hypothetical protein